MSTLVSDTTMAWDGWLVGATRQYTRAGTRRADIVTVEAEFMFHNQNI